MGMVEEGGGRGEGGGVGGGAVRGHETARKV